MSDMPAGELHVYLYVFLRIYRCMYVIIYTYSYELMHAHTYTYLLILTHTYSYILIHTHKYLQNATIEMQGLQKFMKVLVKYKGLSLVVLLSRNTPRCLNMCVVSMKI